MFCPVLGTCCVYSFCWHPGKVVLKRLSRFDWNRNAPKHSMRLFRSSKISLTVAVSCCLPLMPQRCLGLADPAGGPSRPCIFAADGHGGQGRVAKLRDGPRCVFCCPLAFERAWGSRLGKRHVTKKLKQWREWKSPTYEAAFALGIPGLLLPLDLQLQLRRRAQEKPKLNQRTSWLHKKPGRLEAYLHGRPIPEAPRLSDTARSFVRECQRPIKAYKKHWLARHLRAHVWRYNTFREKDFKLRGVWCHRQRKRLRHDWWKLRQDLKKLLPKLAAQSSSRGGLGACGLAWATDEGLLPM